MLSDCSDSVKQFAANAINSSTQRTYASAVRRYIDFCGAQVPEWDASATALNAASIAEFIASLAEEGKLVGRTVSTYLSGLSTWWAVTALSDGPSPFTSPSLKRVVDGAIRHLDDITLLRRSLAAEARPPIALTPSLLLQLEPALRADASPRAKMLLAAAYFGVHTVLRPSEMLGSKQHPNRAPLASSLVFYTRPQFSEVASVASGSASFVPDRFSIDLGATKTDQAGRNAPKVCSVPSAVRALWEWSLVRLQRAETSPLLFALDGTPLLMKQLLSDLQELHERQGLGPARFTGKSFRRGGNSGAAAAGLSIADLQARGGWRNPAMVSVYTTAEAQRERVLAIGRAFPSSL